MAPREHQRLSEELERLVATVSGSNAFVFDAWGLVWCYGTFPSQQERNCLFEQIKLVLEQMTKPLQSGGKLDRMFRTLTPQLYCRSFESVYVLAVWTSHNTNEFLVRASVREALPSISGLTLALPPPGGTDPGSGAQHGRA